MAGISQEVSRFASTVVVKGTLMLSCGVVALVWQDETLVAAMMITGLLLAASGLCEMGIAVASRRETRGWPLALADGLACVGLAALTATITLLPFRATMVLAGLWLALYGGLVGALAFAFWPMARTRAALLAWATLDLLLAAMAIFFRDATIFTLLYVGAGYAIAFGLFQLAAGIWMRRVVLPYVSPTRQAGWKPAPHR